MSKKIKKKRKAKKKALKKKLATGRNQPVLAEQKGIITKPEEPETKEKAPKVKRIAKLKTVIKAKKEVIAGKIKAKRTQIFESSDKIWGIITIFASALLALIIQYYVFNTFNPDLIQANIGQIKSQAQEAYMLTKYFDVIDAEKTNPGYYMGFGETNKDIFSFELKAEEKTALLKELILTKTGNLSENYLTNIRLYEGENAIAQAEINNDKFIFKKFTSVLQPGTTKKYIVKTDIAGDGISGTRFRLSLVNPTDITVVIDEDPVYSLDTYPFDGGYITIVGWRKK